MGLYEDILARVQGIPPDLVMAPPEERSMWPRLSDLPQNLLPPHKRSRVGAVDANGLGVQHALGNDPAGPAIPAALQVHAGMLPPLDQPNTSPFLNPIEREMQQSVGGDPGVAPPLPMARPAGAPLPSTPQEALATVPPAPTGPTDVSARARPAAPAAAPLQIAPPAPQAGMLPGVPSILDRISSTLGDNSNTLLAIGAGFAGAPGWGQGISRAAAAAIPARAADMRQTLTKQTQATGYKALISAGVPDDLARAALGNPEIMKSVTANYLGDRKGELREIGVDRYGNKIWGVFDPFSKKITPVSTALDGTISAPGGGVPAAGPEVSAPAGGSTEFSAQRAGLATTGTNGPVTAENDVTGPDYLQRLKETDPPYARQVEQVLTGDAPFPSGKQAQSPLGRKIIQDVLTVEPGASASDFATRQGVRKDYTSGNSSKVSKAVNTAITHGAGLEKAIADLNNFTMMPKILNPVTGAIQKQYDPKYQKARKEFEVNAENYVRELDFAISGGRPTVSGAAHQRSAFDIDASPEENMASLRKSIELLKGRLDSHAEGFNKGMRTNREGIDFVDPPNRQVYKKLLGETDGHGAPAVPAAPVAPKPGTYRYDAASGQLVPVQ